jgi:hypothetical protein
LSEDERRGLWEVLDDRGRILIVSFIREEDTKMYWLVEEEVG